MIFLAAVLLGLLVGFLWKGKITGLTNMALRSTWLLFIFLAIDVFLNSRFSSPLASEALRWSVLVLLSLQYASLLLLILINRKRWPLLVVGAGECFNFLVIMSNNGRMPVDTSGLPESARLQALLSGQVPHYGALSSATNLPFLGDIIPFWLFSPSLLSIGDILIMIGLFLLIVHAMKERSAAVSD